MSSNWFPLRGARAYPGSSPFVLPESVSIFVQESVNRVPDLSRVVFDPELQRIHARPRVNLVEGVIVMTFLEVRDVARFGEIALIVEKM